MIIRQPVLLTCLVMLSGIVLFLYGWIFDPFSIPFQDYDQLSNEVQAAYEDKAKMMEYVRYAGILIFVGATAALVDLRRRKKKN